MPGDFNPNTNISELIDYHAINRPDAEALVFEDTRLSWGEFGLRINQVANGLIAAGVRRTGKVAIVAENSVEYFVTLFGILRAGACAVPLPGMADAQTLKLMLEDCRAQMLFASRRTLAQAEAARTQFIPSDRCIVFDAGKSSWVRFHDWSRSQDTTPPALQIENSDPFYLIYSSGTTGVPKGILHSHQARTSYWATRDAFLFSGATRMIISTPLYSNTTQFAVLPTVAWGGTVILLRKSDSEAFLRLAQRERATHTIQVPVQYRRLREFPNFRAYDLSAFLWKFSTSAPLSADLKRWLVAQWPGRLTDIYGMTEGGVACFLHAHEHPEKLHTIGVPPPGTELRIVDQAMRDVPRGEVGELIGRSSSMMDGYYNKPEETARSRWLDADGNLWQRSGDLGRMDEDGFVILLDRIKDMIISGGFNVYCADLEAVLAQHQAVEDCAVIGVPSDEWGETPLALVVKSPAADVSAQEIKDWANERLGKFQRLSHVEFREELPRSPIGKLLKRALREPYWKNCERRVG